MRYEPITRNNDFVRAYSRGKSYVHSHIVLYVRKNRAGHTRVGLTASKKIGNAVMRNRARRVMRAALYQVLDRDLGPVDIVLVARGITPRLKSTKLAPTLQKLLQDAGLLQWGCGSGGCLSCPSKDIKNLFHPCSATIAGSIPPARNT